MNLRKYVGIYDPVAVNTVLLGAVASAFGSAEMYNAQRLIEPSF